MKPLVIYHTNESTPCADGFGAAYAAWLKFGDEGAEYLPMKYGQAIPSHITALGRDLYILDFSFNPEVMKAFFYHCTKVVWLDHHASVFKAWDLKLNAFNENFYTEIDLGLVHDTDHEVILDNNRSGALIAWDYFHPSQEAPIFFKHLDDYDRWQFKIDNTREFNTALYASIPWSFKQWRGFIDNCDHFELYFKGKLLLETQAIQVESVITGTSTPCFFRLGILIYEGLATNCSAYLTNAVGHELALKSGTFGLCWYQKANGMIKCSLRSNKGYDVLTLAENFNGGGHTTAAGFEVTNVTLQDLLCPF